MPVQCPGCHDSFTLSGLTVHLKLTRNPQCIAVHEEKQRYRSPSPPQAPRTPPAPQPSTSDSAPQSPSVTPPPAVFDGDYFGDYRATDFEDYDESPGDDESDTSSVQTDDDIPDLAEQDDIEDEEDDPLEDNWEPPPPHEVGEMWTEEDEVQLGAADGWDMDEDNDDGFAQAQKVRHQAEENLRRKTHIITFPGGRAGAPISDEQVPSSHTMYQSSVDSADADVSEMNPFAPFVSRMDWEVARWAKMRGPGSTAVTELLQIDGVRTILTSPTSASVTY